MNERRSKRRKMSGEGLRKIFPSFCVVDTLST